MTRPNFVLPLPLSKVESTLTEATDAPDQGTADAAVAGALLGALSPLVALRAAVGLATDGQVFEHHRRLGRGGQPVVIRSFAGHAPGRRLGYLLSIARGDLRFFGPCPLHPYDSEVADRAPDVVPGLLSPQRLRARTGIDYDLREENVEQSLLNRGNLAIAGRYIIAELLRGGGRATPPDLTILGVDIWNTTMQNAIDMIVEKARSRPMSLVAFVNPDCLNKSVENPDYRRLLKRADAVLPDGIGVKIAAGFQNVDVRENINGTDMFPRLCRRAAEEDLGIYLLGGRPGVADAVAERMTGEVPGLRISGTHHGYFERGSEEAEVVRGISESSADILLVAFGVPRQEFWLDAHWSELGVGVGLGVGGLFDFYSGRIPRAPEAVREMGLEWVWRLAQEPGRMWRRYVVGNPLFLSRSWRDSFKHKRVRGGSDRTSGRPPLLGYGYYGTDLT